MTGISDLSLREFLDKLGSDAPAPGGGSAAALSGAMGAALISMVCNLTKGRDKYAPYENLIQDSLLKSNALIYKLLDTLQDDNNAYNAVMAAFRLPKNTDEEIKIRKIALRDAYKNAVVPPENCANHCIEIMRISKNLLNKSNKNAVSDLAVAAAQAYSGLISALENVRINLVSIERLNINSGDTEYVAERRNWMAEIEAEAENLLKDVRVGAAA